MANRPCGPKEPPAPPETAVSTARPEPEVRRWPHPVDRGPEVTGLPAALHYIHCSLSYQNQLLSEIRALLESLSSDSGEPRQSQGK